VTALGERDLRTYLAERRQDPMSLIEVTVPVSPGPEIASVVKALEPHGKPAVLFRDVKGSGLPVLMGLFGSRRRIANALGCAVEDTLDHVLRTMSGLLPEPIVVPDAPVHDVVVRGEDVDLGDLPFALHSKSDAGPYITAGVVLARDPGTGKLNTGMYRMMITGRNTISVNAAPDHDLGRIFSTARKSGQRVPIAIVLGHHPAYAIASQFKNPTSIDVHALTGALLGGPLPVTPAVTIDLPVPARAEIVLEGVVDPGDRVDEGPFGEFSYYYGAANAPQCEITAITRREDAYFHDLHPTHAEHLCLWLFPGREARLLEAVRRAVPGTKSVRIPFYGGALSAYLQVSKRREGDGKQAVLAAFAADHFLKHVTVVDEDVDIMDEREVLWALNVRFQADRDLISLGHAKGIRMDPSAQRLQTPYGVDTLTAKLGFDATVTLEPQFPERADLPHPGFEELDLSAYLPREAQEWVNQSTLGRLGQSE
jgi:2,5-furandicarboxylate decarboxylase 1